MSAFLPIDLIREVKKRPGIYNKDALVPPRKENKQQLWLEVAEILTPPEEWDSYTEAEKEIRIGEVSNKWKNLRDHFYREVKLLESGDINKKRKYIYFNEMEFVRPYVGYKQPPINKREKKRTESVNSTRESLDNDTDIDMDEFLNIGDKNEDGESKTLSNSKDKEGSSKPKPVIKHTPDTRQGKPSSSVPVVSRAQKDDIIRNFDVLKKVGGAKNPAFKIRESDISFCLSLVPTLRKLSDLRKLSAKIDILKVLHKNMFEIEREEKKSKIRHGNSSNSRKRNLDTEEMEDEYEEYIDIKLDPLNDSDNA